MAVTGEQKALVRSLKPVASDPMALLAGYIDAANSARVKLQADPSDAAARSDYNFAVARVVEIMGEEKLAPWDKPVLVGSDASRPWSFTMLAPDPRPELHPSKFQILPADRYDFRGKLVGERALKDGLGAPVVVVGKDTDFTKIDRFASGKSIYYGMTAVLRFHGDSGAELVLVDPLQAETVALDGRKYPVAADFQAPLALMMAELKPRKNELAGMFKPAERAETARLARLQPYDPDKIPVLCIHGLGDSAFTWVPLIEHLRSDERIRDKYQFWYFNYPTGLPYPMTAAILRKQLDEINARYPDHKDMVIIGHSMGGMISRLLITDSDSKIWDVYFDKPPEQLPVSQATKDRLSEALIFDALPNVSRVIFASPSHRGSDMATGFFGRMGAKLIGNPFGKDDVVTSEAIANMRPEIRASGQTQLPNSVQVLNPDNRFLGIINAIPTKPGIPYHTVLGDRGKGGNLDRTKPVSSDGIVPYWSGHMDGAVSELIVPSDHWSIRHPLGMAEIKRILLSYPEKP